MGAGLERHSQVYKVFKRSYQAHKKGTWWWWWGGVTFTVNNHSGSSRTRFNALTHKRAAALIVRRKGPRFQRLPGDFGEDDG